VRKIRRRIFFVIVYVLMPSTLGPVLLKEKYGKRKITETMITDKCWKALKMTPPLHSDEFLAFVIAKISQYNTSLQKKGTWIKLN
jgi:hypothetical protein